MSPAGADALMIDLRSDDSRWDGMLGDPEAVCTRALRAAAARMDAVGEVSVLLTNDVEMRELNVQWRGIDKATDVLSFPYSGSGIPGQPRPLGDIALGLETAKRDADLMERAFEAHVSHLLVHGFLHLLGYDHIESADAAVMEPLEAGILAGLGWPDPYRTGPYGETD